MESPAPQLSSTVHRSRPKAVFARLALNGKSWFILEGEAIKGNRPRIVHRSQVRLEAAVSSPLPDGERAGERGLHFFFLSRRLTGEGRVRARRCIPSTVARPNRTEPQTDPCYRLSLRGLAWRQVVVYPRCLSHQGQSSPNRTPVSGAAQSRSFLPSPQRGEG